MNSNLSNNEILLLQALRKSYARKNLIDFTCYTFPTYKPNWHHYLIADRLELLARGEIKRLNINMPPRYGKSELVSKRFPAWFLGNYPLKSIIATSYNASLASEFGKKARNVVASLEFRDVFKNVKLSEESAAKLNWTLEEDLTTRPCPYCGSINWFKKTFGRAICRTCGNLGEFAGTRILGEYYGAGVGGGITGKGADILIIDDPLKGRKTAQSETIRKNLWEWYTSEACTRLQGLEAICICSTRWHEDDLTAKVLNLEDIDDDVFDDEKWTVLSLAAIAESDEAWEIYNPDYIEALGTNIIYRKEGEPLWESKHNLRKLNKIRFTNTYEFSALYQQRPQPDSGGLFKRENFRYAELNNGVYTLMDQDRKTYFNESECLRFVTMDLGITGKSDSDYTVICTWDLTRNNDLILHHIYRKQIDGAEHINLLWSIYSTYHPSEFDIERVAYQLTLIQTAIQQGLPARELRADTDKYSRALPAAAKMEAHKIFLLKTLENLHIIENELLQFPNAKNDDIVDNFGYAAARASTIYEAIYISPKKSKSNINSLDNRKLFLQHL